MKQRYIGIMQPIIGKTIHMKDKRDNLSTTKICVICCNSTTRNGIFVVNAYGNGVGQGRSIMIYCQKRVAGLDWEHPRFTNWNLPLFFSNDELSLIRTLLGITKENKQIYYVKCFLTLAQERGSPYKHKKLMATELHGTWLLSRDWHLKIITIIIS